MQSTAFAEMQIRFAPLATRRYDDLLAYLREQNPLAADRMVAAVDRALARLRRFPLSGPQVREFPQLPLRQFLVQPYRFFYRVDHGHKLIWLVDIWHGAQDIRAPELPAP